MRRVFFLAQAELLHIVRDRATLAQILVVPMVQILILANAATFEIRDTRMWVVDLDRSSASRGLVNRFAASGHFDVTGTGSSIGAADEALLQGRTTLALVIPHADQVLPDDGNFRPSDRWQVEGGFRGAARFSERSNAASSHVLEFF